MGPHWAGQLSWSVVEPLGSLAAGQAVAEILEVPGPLFEEGPSGHGPHSSAPGSAALPGLRVATESQPLSPLAPPMLAHLSPAVSLWPQPP